MGINLPNSASEVINRIIAEVKGELPKSNPYLKDSLIRATPVGLGQRAYDYYYELKQSIKEAFPATATEERLQMWADLKNMLPLEATAGLGPVTWTGVAGSIISPTDIWTIGALEYKSQADVTLEDKEFSVSNLTASGTTAVCITDDDHLMHDGMSFAISGVNETDWNDTWNNIQVLDTKRFKFTVPSGLVSPATGTIVIQYTGGSGTVVCTSKGTGTNQEGGTLLTAQSTVTGVNDTAGVQFDGIQGGIDDETEADYQARIVYRWRNPQTPFNPATIESKIREINGNTRVWVHRVTPVVGAVTAYFVRDNDETIIPSASEVQTALDVILAITPANTEESDVHIEAPVGIPYDVVVSNIVPDSLSMRQAVEDIIDTHFRGGIREGEDMDVEKLSSAIFQTYDVVQGRKIENFSLDAPVSDGSTAAGEIPILNSVTVNN
jgi:uncharacterized phage protein gp47/JayE